MVENLATFDPEIFQIITQETERQEYNLEFNRMFVSVNKFILKEVKSIFRH